MPPVEYPTEVWGSFTVEDFLGFFGFERSDHEAIPKIEPSNIQLLSERNSWMFSQVVVVGCNT